MRGLMGASGSSFPAGEALWIVPCRGVHTFAMRFPLDLVYLDHDRRVIDVQENVVPWRVAPLRFGAESVMELPLGTIRKSRTEKGDKIEIITAKHPEAAAA
jgi:uncharacterized membrane protein (UPF0127 family)